MANVRGILGKVMSARGAAGGTGRRGTTGGGLGTGGGMGSGMGSGMGRGTGGSGQRGQDEAIGRGVRSVLSRFRR